MLEIQDTLVSLDVFSRHFCCDISDCHGICCVEGDAGAPVEVDEIAQMEDALEVIWDELTPEAQDVINRQGIVYADPSGELVTSIVSTGHCVFAADDEQGNTQCLLERACRQNRTTFLKPISCHLYPIRLTNVGKYTGVNYHKWDVCNGACALGSQMKLPLYQFLKQPLIRRFGQEWWDECDTAYHELMKAGYIE